jgi:HEAT repeat protein
LEQVAIMFKTKRPSASARLWPWLIRPLSLAMLVVVVIIGARAADPPPPDPVDDFRAVFRKDYESVILRSTQQLPELRDKLSKLEKDPLKKNPADVAKAKENVDKAETELKTALDDRNTALDKRIKDDLAKADDVEKVALVNIIGDEGQRLRYPINKVIPDYVSKLHPEDPYLIALTEAKPGNSLDLRLAATLALGKSNGDPKMVVPALAKLLRDPQTPTALRLAAGEALSRPIRRLLQAPAVYQDPTGKARVDTSIGDELRSVLLDSGHLSWPVLLDGLKDRSPEVRLACLSSAKDLSVVFRDNAQVAQSKDFYADYGELIKAFRDTMPTLQLALDDKDPAIQGLGLSILHDLATARLDLSNKLGPKPAARTDEPRGPAALPTAFVSARADDPPKPAADPDVLPSALKTALPALVKSLQSKFVETRRAAAAVLELLGDDAAAVIADLARGLRDPDPFVRWTLLRTLGRLAPREAKVVVAAVVPLVRDSDGDVRLAAMKTLEQFGKEAGGAVPALVDLLPRSEASIQLAALKSLQALNTWDTRDLAVVAELLQNPDASVRISAAETLGRAGKTAAATRPQLEKALNDEDEKVRSAASEALLRIKK